MASPLRLYLDQNYVSGLAKAKPAFRDLGSVLRGAVDRGDVVVLESDVHVRESAPRPDLRLLETLRELSGGRRLAAECEPAARETRRRMEWTIAHEFPERPGRASDDADLEALALAITQCELVTCDAFMADVIRRTRLDLRHRCELYTGRRPDVVRLRERLAKIRA